MVIFFLPLLVAIVGLLMFALASNGTAKEVGKIMFFVGLLVTLLFAPREMSATFRI